MVDGPARQRVEVTFVGTPPAWEIEQGLTGILTLPIAVWEFSLGVYLIVKGFKPSPITADLAANKNQPTHQAASV